MGFLESYKRLDNLCKDLLKSETGVTSYIESMQSVQNAQYRVPNWDSDYRKLKRYRYIRNQIVHENYANEENMCSEDDTLWLENFYQRILDRADPLAMYYAKPTVSSSNLPEQIEIESTNKKTPIWARLLIAGCILIGLIYIVNLIYTQYL